MKTRPYSLRASVVAAKGLTTAVFLAAAIALPLAGRPTLWLHWKIIVLMASIALVFFTQPAIDPAGARGGADRASMWLIFVFSILSVGMPVVEWRLAGAVPAPGAVEALGLGVLLAGIALRLWAIYTLGRFFTAAVRLHAEHALITAGPYRRVRHPSYLGAYLAFIGLALLFGATWGLAVAAGAMWAVYRYRIRVEEAALVDRFGEQYRDYQRLVPALWPGWH